MSDYNTYGNLERSRFTIGLAISCRKPHDCLSFGGVFTFDVTSGRAAGALYNETEVTVYLGDYGNIQETPAALRAEVQRKSSSEIFKGEADWRACFV